jgi:hypothetical protein
VPDFHSFALRRALGAFLLPEASFLFSKAMIYWALRTPAPASLRGRKGGRQAERKRGRSLEGGSHVCFGETLLPQKAMEH